MLACSEKRLICAVLFALIAAALFPTQMRVPFPQAQAVAISGRRIVAVSGEGKGVFIEGGKVVARFDAGDNPSSIAFAGPDLVIAHHERAYVTVHRPPSFAPVQVAVDVTPHTHFAAVADLDGDGKLDIVVNDMGGKRVVVLWGPDFAEHTAALTGSKGHAYFNVAVAGNRVFVPCWPQPQVAVLRARGRQLAPERLIDLPNPAFFVAADGSAVATFSGSVADASRDGVVILASGARLDGGRAPVRLASAGGLLAVAGLGGTVKVGDETLEVPHPQDVALGDLDGDGKPDLAVAAESGVLIFLTR
jgi:hypothetical protein